MRDPISSTSHLLAALVALVFTAFLFRLTRSRSARFFGISATLLYSASALYHAPLASREELRTLQLIDQSMIFVLILGSYAPMAIYMMPWSIARWGLRIMTGCAVLGILALWVLPKPPHGVLVGVFIAMGAVGMVTLAIGMRPVRWDRLVWLLGGGVFYVCGGVCELLQWPTMLPGWFGPHEVLHVCDMAGTMCHAVLIVRLTVPPRSSLSLRPEPS